MARSVKKNFLINSAYQIFQIITPLVTTPYLSRVLGASGMGLYSYTYSIALYFFMFAMLGMSNYGVRAIAAVADDAEKRSSVFCSVYASQLLIALPIFLLYLVYCFVMPQGGLAIALLWGMYVFSASINITWLFFGMEDFAKVTIINFVAKVLELLGIFVLIHGPQDVYVYCGIDSLCFLVISAFTFPFLRRYVHFVRPTWHRIKEHFLPNVRLFVPVIAISLYTTLNSVLLGVMSTMEQTGYFDYSQKMARMPLAVITAMGTVMFPHMSRMFAAGQRKESLDLLEVSMWFMLAGGLAMAFGIVGIAPVFVPVFFGPGYESCVNVMIILAWIVPLICTANVIGGQYLLPLYRDNQYTASVCVGAAVNIALCLLLIERFGALGAAIGAVTAELAVLSVQAILVRRELPLFRYARNSLPFVIFGIIMLLSIRGIEGCLMNVVGVSVVMLVAEIAGGIVVFCALALTYCIITKNRYFYRLVSRGKSSDSKES